MLSAASGYLEDLGVWLRPRRSDLPRDKVLGSWRRQETKVWYKVQLSYQAGGVGALLAPVEREENVWAMPAIPPSQG